VGEGKLSYNLLKIIKEYAPSGKGISVIHNPIITFPGRVSRSGNARISGKGRQFLIPQCYQQRIKNGECENR
jgi:hypothetical protein